MKRIAIFALGIVCLGALNCLATDRPGSLKDTLKSVPAAELPAKAADLVRNAKLSQRGEVTVNVVRAAVGMNPAAAPAIVGAIARAVPDMAALAAGTAAGEQPKQASAIARAHAADAPARSGKVVAASLRVVPDQN